MTSITLPNGWRPRKYQLPLWSYMENGGKRAVAIWHRRAGKDEVALHWAAVAAMQRPGTYWHMLPEYSQGRKAIWAGVNTHTGKRRVDEAFPKAIRKRTNEQEMFIEFKNGSTWQVIGSDRYDSIVGSPPVGIVFSEWALARPGVWGYLSPILVENNGWSIFITTPRGRNHAKRTLDLAREPEKGDGWFSQVLTVDDTARIAAEAGERVPMTPAAIEEQRDEYHGIYGRDEGDALIEQEYFCSFEAAILGAYYGRLMTEAEQQGRICEFKPDDDAKVHVVFDIGVHDSTAMWWFQIVGSKILVLDYYESSGHGSQHYVDEMKRRPYRYTKDEHGLQAWLPPDVKVKEWGAGLTRIETLISKGISPQRIPEHKIDDGINAARQLLPRCIFRKGPTDIGCEMLRQYKKDWDEDNRAFRNKPKHDWSSHGADAFRYLAMSYKEMVPAEPKPARKLLTVGPGNEVTLDDLWPAARRSSGRI